MVHAPSAELPKLKVKSEEGEDKKKEAPKSFSQLSSGLRSMQIRTYRITYEPSSKKEDSASEFV